MSRLAQSLSAVGAVCFWVAVTPLAHAQSSRVSSSPASNALDSAAGSKVSARCPVEVFREVLSMSPEAKAQWLATHSPVTQKLLAAKLKEYESLPLEQRELRLYATELRWYLVPLLSTPATNRPAQLTSVPPALRPIIEDRLRVWDSLPASVQAQLLNSTNNYFSKVPITPGELRQKLFQAAQGRSGAPSPTWGQMSEEQRRQLTSHFSDMLELKPAEQRKVLGTLSEPERRQIENTLEVFQRLAPYQRKQCLDSFERFASLSPAERQEFLTNARHWQLMAPAERQAWKELVENARRRPPLPPGLQRLRPQEAGSNLSRISW